MRGSAVFRTGVAPGGALAGPWVRNPLWTRARAVPSLDLRFADNKSLVDAVTGAQLVTFTRASSGTYVDSDGLIKSATTNEPRFDHNPTTGESFGLLVEEARTNLQLRSEEFDNTGTWSRTGLSTVTANSSVAPDGLTTADTLVEDASTGSHRVFAGTSSLVASASYSFSVHVKASTRTVVRVEVRDSVGAFAVQDFNLTTQAITSAGSGTGAISALGNGWFRCTITGTTSVSGGVGVVLIYSMQVAGNVNYTGTNGTSAIFLWAAQLEAGAFPTSYIPTTTATVTRAADVASITGSNFSSWFSPTLTDHTFYADCVPRNAVLNGTILEGYEGANLKGLTISFDGAGTRPRVLQRHGTSRLDTSNNYPLWSVGVPLKIAVSTSNASQTASNGALPPASAGAPAQIDWTSSSGISIGSRIAGSSAFVNNHIRRIVFWNQPLPGSTLQQITQP